MTMLRAAVVVLCLFFPASAVASAPADEPQTGSYALTRHVNAATASVVAQHHLARSGAAGSFGVSGIRSVCDDRTSATLYYCFDLAPAGYVVVSADTTLPPVIAYSYTSPPPCDLTPGTPLADLLRWDLQQRITQVELLPETVVRDIRDAWANTLAPARTSDLRGFEQWPPAGTTPTGGWIETTWHQSAPYNNLCPMDLVAGARSVAGCPSLAMAQILDYHGRLNATQFAKTDDYYHNYGGNQYWIDDAHIAYDFPSFPELNAHLDTLFDSYFYGTAPADTPIAALVFACGVAARQVYGASGSDTFSVDQAFDAYQRFGCDTAVLLDAGSPDLYTRLAQNMIDGHPAHLAVVDPGWSYGHNLVVDGYNTNDYYHLNFGWNGSYNGWYLVPSGLPMSLTVIEGVILDILTVPCDPLDCTCDGSVTTQDFLYYGGCLSGPGNPFASPGCAAFDYDADGDVDLRDFGVFQEAFND